MTTGSGKRVAAAVALFIGAFVRPSAACDMDAPSAREGPLFNLSQGGVAAVPRNLAFLVMIDRVGASGETFRVGDFRSGEPIEGRPIAGVIASPRHVIVRPEPLLPANTEIIPLRFGVPGSLSLSTGDFLDESPPAQPELLSGDLEFHDSSSGCSYSTCGDYTDMELVIAAAPDDDRTPSPNLIYAVYLGDSEASALSATNAHCARLWSGANPVGLRRQ